MFPVIQSEIKKEIERRKLGKDMQDFKRKQEEEKTKRLMEERNREKAEEKAARERVKLQIALVSSFLSLSTHFYWLPLSQIFNTCSAWEVAH